MTQNLRPLGAGGSAQDEMERVGYLGGLLMPDLSEKLALFISVIVVVAGWATVGAEVLLRHRFGVRYLNIVRVLLGFVTTILLFVTLGYMNRYIFQGYFTTGGLIVEMLRTNPIVLGFAVFSLLHLLHSWWRNRNGVVWHTRSFGESDLVWLARRLPIQLPFPLPQISAWFVYRWVEPLLLLVVSILIRRFNPIFADWFTIMAFLLWLKNNLLFYQQLNALYDRADAMIEAQFWTEAVKGAPTNKTAGFTVAQGIPNLPDKIVHTGRRDVRVTVAEVMRQPTEDGRFSGN